MNNKDIAIRYSSLISNIKYFRKQNHLTQEQLAERADLSVSYIKQLELGHIYKNISFTSLVKLSRALNIGIDELCRDNRVNQLL